MMSIQIHQAKPDDTQSVSSILLEAAQWLEETGTPLWNATDLNAEAIQGEMAAGLYWLAHVEDEAAGCVRYQLEDLLYWPDATLGEAAYLHRLAVRRAHAGGAISTALLDWAKAHARKRGHNYLRLDCDADRPALHTLYERHGFKPVGEGEVGPHAVVLYEYDLGTP